MNIMSQDAIDLDVKLEYPGFKLQVTHRGPLQGVTALFGPSGSGKSTLLRVIAGLEKRAVGRVAFGGHGWQDNAGGGFVPAHRRGAAIVFQDSRLFWHLSVERNLDFAEKRSRARDGRIKRADVIAALDLGPLLGQASGTLSGGERQRVAIGRALLSRPRLLLMDEPLAALDARRKHEILNYIVRLPEAFSIPVLYVTHAIDEVTSIADRMLLIDKGSLVASGPIDEVLTRLDLGPATGRFEAGVALVATVRSHDDAWQLSCLDIDGQLLHLPLIAAPVGSAVRVRVRARDVTLVREAPADVGVTNILRGTVLEIAEEKNTAFAETVVGISGQRLRARLTRRAVAALSLEPGAEVCVLLNGAAIDRRAVSLARGLL